MVANLDEHFCEKEMKLIKIDSFTDVALCGVTF